MVSNLIKNVQTHTLVVDYFYAGNVVQYYVFALFVY